MKIKETPKGFTCSACGRFHEYTAYVYAHCEIDLEHTCGCGAKHTILDLVAYDMDGRKAEPK